MNAIRPIVGQWYRGGTNELFEVVAIDDQDQTIEIQYFDGTVTEMEFDSWNEQLLDELIDRPMRRRTGRAPWTWKPKTWIASSRTTRAGCGPRRTIDRCAAEFLDTRFFRPASRADQPAEASGFCRFARPSSFRGLRNTTSKISPGTAIRQVTTKKFAHPITGTRCPAIAPVTLRGKVARADSSAY